MRANFKSRYLKTTLGKKFEKTMHGRGPKIGSYVPLISFNKLKSGIFEKIFFRFLWAKMCQKWPKLGKRAYIFAHKNRKSGFLHPALLLDKRNISKKP